MSIAEPRGHRARLAFWAGWGQGWRAGFAAGKASGQDAADDFRNRLLLGGLSPDGTKAVAEYRAGER